MKTKEINMKPEQNNKKIITPNDEIILKKIWKKCADELIQITNPQSEYIIDETNKDIINNLFWWYYNDPRSSYDLHKGILLKGTKGTGKTTLIKAFRKYFMHIKQPTFRLETAMKITLDYAQNGTINEWLTPHIVAIDEIGRENIGKYYGNELNVIGYLLHERYSLWQNTGICTIATTNLDGNEIENHYGEIIRDRTKEMFNHIPMIGNSKRN